MSNRAKGISLCRHYSGGDGESWGFCKISVPVSAFTNLEISFSAVRWLAELTFVLLLRNHPH